MPGKQESAANVARFSRSWHIVIPAQAGISQRATIARSRLVGRDDCRFGNRGDIWKGRNIYQKA